ncbi:MAG: MarR family winged helix-turn-helix transcriptional regulator [Pseudomonadota bacterium]
MPDTFDLMEFLPYRLAILSERVSRRLATDYERTHGLTVAEWRVLVHLLRVEAASVRDIRDYANLDKPKVSRAVARLEEAGLVKKRRGSGDGRLVAISLTDAGRAAMAEVLPAAQDVEARLLSALNATELETLSRVMEKLHAVLDADPAARPRTHVPATENPDQD